MAKFHRDSDFDGKDRQGLSSEAARAKPLAMGCPVCGSGLCATRNKRAGDRHPMECGGWSLGRSMVIWGLCLGVGFPVLVILATMVNELAGVFAGGIFLLAEIGTLMGVAMALDFGLSRGSQASLFCKSCGFERRVGWE